MKKKIIGMVVCILLITVAGLSQAEALNIRNKITPNEKVATTDTLTFNPPWEYNDFDPNTETSDFADASIGNSGTTSYLGYAGKGGAENDFYASAGLPDGEAIATAWLDHHFMFSAPVTGTYDITFSYSVTGLIFGVGYSDEWTPSYGYAYNIITVEFKVGSREETYGVAFEEYKSVIGGDLRVDWSETVTINTDLSGGLSYYIGCRAFIKSYARDLLAGATAHMRNMEFCLEEVTIDVPCTPQTILEVTPSNYDYGDVEIGSSETKTFILENTGDATAEIYKIWIDASMSNYFKFTSGESPNTFASDIVLGPGETLDIPIKYSPLMEKHDECRFTVWATNCDNVEVGLEGTGVESPSPPSCFPAGTKITMADGSFKNIEDIKIGDRILSYDLDNKKSTSWKVRVLERPMNYVYSINGGLIETSADHPFYIQKSNGATYWGTIKPLTNAFRFKGDTLPIEIGDKIFTKDGKWITINSVERKPEMVQTYNIISYKGDKNYFANNLLVHEDYITIFYHFRHAIDLGENPVQYLFQLFRHSNYQFLP